MLEAKDNNCSVGDGIQQALGYAETLQIPFVFSSNGDGFVFYDRTVTSGTIEQNLQLHEFPSEHLLSLCDRLEAQLTTAKNEPRLLEAVLHEALAPAV